jgi:Domain of unknown function (DUF4396)
MVPAWLTILSLVSLALAVVCALVVAIDIACGRRQRMWIMNVVWPVTALYSGPLGLWAYFAIGRRPARSAMQAAESAGAPTRPTWQSIGLAATHCGAGCTLGDLLAEAVILSFVPFTLFGQRIFAGWVVDYACAFVFGIAFQYFTIAPMQHLPPGRAILAALKADSLSLSAWQVGMYGWMAIATFLVFGHAIDKTSPVFWFMMQIAMLAGFATSYPTNWWLVRAGIKEKM